MESACPLCRGSAPRAHLVPFLVGPFGAPSAWISSRGFYTFWLLAVSSGPLTPLLARDLLVVSSPEEDLPGGVSAQGISPFSLASVNFPLSTSPALGLAFSSSFPAVVAGCDPATNPCPTLLVSSSVCRSRRCLSQPRDFIWHEERPKLPDHLLGGFGGFSEQKG